MRGLAVVALVLGGCSSGAGHANTPAPVAGPVVAAAATNEAAAATTESATTGSAASKVYDAAEVVCARAVKCGTIGRSQLEECRKGPGASRLTLVWGFEEMLGIPRLVAEGRLKPVPGAEQECLAFLAGAPCSFDRRQAPKGCSGGPSFRMLAPGVAPGGKCTRWDECIDGFCTAQTACEGVCKARSRIGEACGANQICGDDGYCWEGKCTARAGVGAECGGHWQWCQDGLFCDGYQPERDDEHYPSPAVHGRCSAGKQLGEGCVPPVTTTGEVCAAGLVCDWGVDQPVCAAPRNEGDECRWIDVCAGGLVCAGIELGGFHPTGKKYGVRKPGRCTRPLDAGDACEPRAFLSGCPASMVCDEQTRVCRSTGHAGDPCVSSWITKPHANDVPLRTDGCFGANYCEVKTRTCKPEIAKGQRCTPQKFGVEDEPCFLGKCDAKTRRCVVECTNK